MRNKVARALNKLAALTVQKRRKLKNAWNSQPKNVRHVHDIHNAISYAIRKHNEHQRPN